MKLFAVYACSLHTQIILHALLLELSGGMCQKKHIFWAL